MVKLSRVKFSPWLIALAAAGIVLEASISMWVGLVCVLLHEFGHALAAQACGASVESIEIAPFGGVARIKGLEQLPVGQSIIVALAGPLVNLVLLMACGYGAYAMPQHLQIWAELMDINLVLCAFNLLPAYPMDGGRVLCALLRSRAGLVRAQRLTAWLGIALGVLLVALGLISMHYIGKVNVTLLICGGYVIFVAGRAMRGTTFSYMQTMSGRMDELRAHRVLPVRTIAVQQDATDAEVFARLLPGALYRVVYLDEDMHVVRKAWEGQLMQNLYGHAPRNSRTR